MRPLLFVRSTDRTDLDQFGEEVARIRDAFDRYLDGYPVKTARTKTSLMGPVGKILSEVRSGRWDAESLTGFALNIHLMSPNARGYIDPQARAALAEGTRELFGLLHREDVPPAAQDKLLDRIDYGLYWIRRRKGLEFIESLRSEFGSFLRLRYKGIEALNQSWGSTKREQLQDFAQAPYPSKKAKRYARSNDAYKSDVNTFWEERGEPPAEVEEDEE